MQSDMVVMASIFLYGSPTSNGNSIIEIEDHGNGMSPQQQKQIFARNYTTARKSSGSGLGLAISKRLAEQIGAELEVYSIQNERTTFSIILKVRKLVRFTAEKSEVYFV